MSPRPARRQPAQPPPESPPPRNGSVRARDPAEALGRLQAELASLRRLPGRGLLDDPVALSAAKYHFIASVAAAVAVCGQVIADDGLRGRGDDADAFRVLAEQGRLPVDLADRLLDLVRLRDRLVGGTADDAEFVIVLGAAADDLGRFRVPLASRGAPAERLG